MGHLLNQDAYLLLADYQAYVECQDEVHRSYRDRGHWTRMSMLNVRVSADFLGSGDR